MDYYLYSHSNADGIFYIGKGINGSYRKNHFLTNRTKEWTAIAEKGYTSKIEANGTEADILALEKVVIKSLVAQGVKLVNKQHNPNWTPTAEARKKVADAQRGRKHSKAVKQKMSNTIKEQWKQRKLKKPNSYAYLKTLRVGKKHSIASKKLMSYNIRKALQHRRLVKANEYRG